MSDLLRLAAAASGALGDSEMPIVWNHGDFHGGNIFRITKGYAAVDWVDAAPGLPFLDLFKFVEFWHVHVTSSWKAPLRTARFRELFVAERSPNHIVDVVRGEISRYARRLGVPPRLIPVLAVHSWTRLALHHSHLAARGARGHAAPARIFGGHVRALAEGTDVLFTVYE